MDTRLEPIPKIIILPPEEPKPEASPVWFVLFAVVMISGAAVAGLIQSGKISVDKLLGRKPAVAVTAGAASGSKAAHPTPTPVPLKAGAFVVSSISVGQTSYAIINGVSHMNGDLLSAPGATGWRVRRIDDTVVWVQNGMTVTSIPLTTTGLNVLDDKLHSVTNDGLKPLNDTLHPLN